MGLWPALLVVFVFWKRWTYRFTYQVSFHLNCKFLGTTFAVWFHHVKIKHQPWVHTVVNWKVNVGFFLLPVSRSSNTSSEGAVVKKTAQVNFGMCIYKEKNTICVPGSSCLCGCGFAPLAIPLLLSRVGQLWHYKVQKWVVLWFVPYPGWKKKNLVVSQVVYMQGLALQLTQSLT